ncbi:hypothetical protein UFOVP642_3 [uncultured Caudovirales phage]|uniref:Uncharacterized protein n=1 Tax=uncultured Caudovirales phage TaxID=2100421 RepID=A0A6J5N8T1_9CAUD|nr:hypothetical protein UFOVP642_3 [uncultured Caudovirales phage]
MQNNRVTVKFTPRDKRMTPCYMDYITPEQLHRFVQANKKNECGQIEIIRGADLPWAREIIKQFPVVA